MDPKRLGWQSKLVLLLVLPWTFIGVFIGAQEWFPSSPRTVAWSIGLSASLGLVAWALRSGTPGAAFSGAILTASLMFSTARLPFSPLRTGLVPVLAFLVLTSVATRFGRARKESLGTAEQRHGRGAAQVAANLGCAALIALPQCHQALIVALPLRIALAVPFLALPLAALAEAAADTLSSEIGQVLGGRPVLVTTLQRVDHGTDGAVTLPGSIAGILAAVAVSAAGAYAFSGGWQMTVLAAAGGVFGLFFDSLLGATLERREWLNNDAVNFLSTASAAAFTLAVSAAVAR